MRSSTECYGYINMSKTLTIGWTNSSPHPTCGYKAFYRRKGDSSYSHVDTSGSTSGSTSIAFLVSAPSSYEGYIVSDCCSGATSLGAPFGVNGYSPLVIAITGATGHYSATITSTYANSYDVYVSGTFNVNISGSTSISFSLLYPAGNTTYTQSFAGSPSTTPTLNTVVSSLAVSSITPSFNGGGSIQQFDPVNTPPYIMFYWSSLAAWNGNPANLPSFTTDLFTTTEQDGSGNVLEGILTCSWAAEYPYSNGDAPYDRYTFVVTDPGTNIIGTATIDTIPMGLRTMTITLTRSSISYPLTVNTLLTLTTKLSNGSTLQAKTFYIPS